MYTCDLKRPSFRHLLQLGVVLLSGQALAALLTCSAIAANTGQTAVVALTGDSSPDGNGVFSEFGYPIINSSGQIAFSASLTGIDSGIVDNSGIFRIDGPSTVKILRGGEVAPGGGTFPNAFTSPYAYQFNDAGQVSFAPTLIGGDPQKRDGIFLGDGLTVRTIVREGDVPPDGVGTIGENDSFRTKYFLNSSGQVAFNAEVSGFPAHAGGERIFLGNGLALTEIVRSGQSTPGFVGTHYHVGDRPNLNDSGDTAFISSINDSATVGMFLFHGTGNAEVVRTGMTTPGGDGEFITVFSPVLNNGGQIAFLTLIENTASGVDESAVFLRDSTGLVEIVRAGEPAPDGNGEFLAFPPTVRGLSFNGDLQIAFRAVLTNTSSPDSDVGGVFRWNNGIVTQAVRGGAPAPDENGVIAIGPLAQAFYMNEKGQIALQANVNNTSGGTLDNRGIFLFDGSLGLIQVARKGDSILDSTITELQFDQANAGFLPNTGLRREGPTQLVYRFVLGDGRQGIAVWTMVPEPGGILLGGVAVVGVGCFRRRS